MDKILITNEQSRIFKQYLGQQVFVSFAIKFVEELELVMILQTINFDGKNLNENSKLRLKSPKKGK